MVVPEKFPFGVSDHLNLGRPEWLVQPDPYYYVVKNRPISIVCRAVPAIRITFRCAGEPDDSFVSCFRIVFVCLPVRFTV